MVLTPCTSLVGFFSTTVYINVQSRTMYSSTYTNVKTGTKRQHAFQTGKSTESALHQLVGRIERALDSNQYSLGVFFDIEGAFDNTPIKSVSKALAEWKVPMMVRSWVIAMLSQCTARSLLGL